jgi:tetratricopeptide (TPR) repeat protein
MFKRPATPRIPAAHATRAFLKIPASRAILTIFANRGISTILVNRGISTIPASQAILAIAVVIGMLVLPSFNLVALAQQEGSGSNSTQLTLTDIERDIAQFNVSDRDFEALTRMLEANPNDCYTHFLLCRCFERKGLMDMAEEQLALVHKLETRPEDILKRLNHHIEAGELSEAFTMAPIVFEKTSKNPAFLLLKAIFQQSNGLTVQSEAILNTLLARPDCPLGAATALATIRLDAKQWQEAIDLAERDIKIKPSYLGARLAKGQALMAMGKFAEVITTLKEPLAEHPFSQRLNALMYEAYRRQGNLEPALHCALRNLAGSDYTTYYESAQFKVRQILQNMPSRISLPIIKKESESIDRTTYAMKFHFFLGQVYFKMRIGAKAREEIQKALDLDPTFQPNWYEMGRIKEVFYGDLRGAAMDFQKARQLQRSDLKASIAFIRVAARLRNSSRDLALAIKNIVRHPS